MAVNENNSYRISKTAIQALLARVYHETSNFEKAIPYALNALTDGRYVLDTDAASIESQWRQDASDEIILEFDLMPQTMVKMLPYYRFLYSLVFHITYLMT